MTIASPFVPAQTDIAIVGAGPHALTLVTHLLQKRQQMHSRVLVFDPSGTWLHQWQQQFAALEIPHLRSPAVHHPDPNPYALRRFAESRPDELFSPYDLPGTPSKPTLLGLSHYLIPFVPASGCGCKMDSP